ncbi:GntR family transcriptional regulator [Paenarthrobacter sp. NPDC089714]|uniref:GntR family transcriptional regulator n=1 Tax=Paenarthrobacter sp. NPDC089714 TaxID=3364377 RepID=UPI003819BE6F
MNEISGLPWTVEQSTSVASQIAASTARAVVEGEIEAGCLLTEVELAAANGASRTPAREAMLRLERWGLVQLVPKKGAIVTNPSARERRELLAVRSMLEVNAVSADIEDEDRRRQLLEALDVNLRAQRQSINSPADFALLDYEFHLRIIANSQNSIVDGIAKELGPRLYRLTFLAVDSLAGELKALYAEHVALADAVRGGDDQAFRHLIGRHLSLGHARYAVAK